MPVPCRTGCGKTAMLKRPKTGDALCKECFFWAFETEIHFTITKGELFKLGDSVAIGASGGKDSTVLAYVLKTLNQRYKYGLNLMLLSIDEGITGYRDDSLETVKQNRDDYEMPLKILSYKDLYGWTMDEIVAQIGRKNNCTFCGVFRRQALDRGAAMLGVKCIATGHNADDIAETVLMNVLRGDIARLKRCTAVSTGSEGTIPRVKPLKYTYEKEIVMYAHYKKLVYFSTECVFAPNAYRGHARALLKDLEKIRPSCIMDIIYSGETMGVKEQVSLPTQRICSRCKFVSSQEVCKACVLLEGLNKGLPKLGIGKSSKAKRMLEEYSKNLEEDGKENLNEAINELNKDMEDTTISNSKNSCKSGSCYSNKSKKSNEKDTSISENETDTSIGENETDTSIGENETDTSIGENATDRNMCKNKCNGKCSSAPNEVQSESKLKTILKEYSIEQANDNSTNVQKHLSQECIKNSGENSDEENFINEDETCIGGCEGMGISF